MLTKKIKFVDFNGTEREEEFVFNLNKAEVMKLITTEGDYTIDKYLQRLTTERNGRKIIGMFEDIIHMSYGVISLDGRRIEKTEEIWRNFSETEAYSILLMEIVTDAKKAAEFVNGIIPQDLADEIRKIAANNPEGIPAELKDYADSYSVPLSVVDVAAQ